MLYRALSRQTNHFILSTPIWQGLLRVNTQGEVINFWNGGANVLIRGLQFGEGEIIWSLKFRGPKSNVYGLKFGVTRVFEV